MTELEQKLRDLLRSQGVQDLEIYEAVKLLEEAYDLGRAVGFTRGHEHGSESMRAWLQDERSY
jgi:uncharacterized protein Smg (DUF494 family)